MVSQKVEKAHLGTFYETIIGSYAHKHSVVNCYENLFFSP